MPQEYLGVCTGLSGLVKGIRYKLYTGPIDQGTTLSLSGFHEAIESLRRWLAELPTHLGSTVAAPPSHKRPVSLLHLRYWSAVILITRPFLICILFRSAQLQASQRLKHFEELAKICVAAAEQSLVVLEVMANSQLTSNLIMFDFYFTLDLLQIFIIASLIQGSKQHQDHSRSCFAILQSLSASGHQKLLMPEVVFQLQKLGLATATHATADPFSAFNASDPNYGSFIDTYDMYVIALSRRFCARPSRCIKLLTKNVGSLEGPMKLRRRTCGFLTLNLLVLVQTTDSWSR